tara:strand:+ start:3439 stop:8841 length:5403 start_codon:yes stop_codon:yes gene_type:complete
MKKTLTSILLGLIHFFVSAQTEFITTWKTDNSGVSADNQITIPTHPDEAYDYSVDWGDGSSDTNIIGSITHTYDVPGIYQVSISGEFPRIYFNESGDKDKILNIKQWGNTQWTSMESAFAGCSNLSVGAEDIPNLSNVTSLRRMFYYCNYINQNDGNTREFSNFNGIENFDSWDVSTITDMSYMFDKSTFNQDIFSWDVSNVLDMSYMFFSSSFNKDINSWDVSNVVNMAGLFGSGMFDQDISGWDVSNVVNIDFIFNSTYFNHDVTAWNVSNLVSMRHAFSQGHFDQDLSSWDVSNVLDMSNAFDDSDLSKENYDALLKGWSQLSGLKTGVVLGANDAVYCTAESERTALINDYGWVINDYGIDCETEVPFVTTWKTDNPGPSNDNQITIPTSATDIYDYRVDWGDGTFDEGVTGDITHTYAQPGVYEVSITGKFPRIYFNGYEFGPQTSDDLKLLSVDQWGSNRWKSMGFAFAGCENMDMKATDIPDFSRGVSLTGMFWDAKSLEGNASIANWDIEKTTSINFMFKGATSFNGPIGEWNVTGKRDIYGMFENAESFDQDLSNWNVQAMENMTNLFKGSGLSNRNYDKILIGWSQSPTLKTGVQLGAPENYYCSAAYERQYMIDTYGWIIDDAGPNEECMFVTTWKTDNPGRSADNQITIPTFPDETYNYTVHWGDGTSDDNVSGDITHTYATAGTYQVSIMGDFPRIYFNFFPEDEAKDYEKLILVNQWGSIEWSSMADAFARCVNLDVVAMDLPDLTNVGDMAYMFRGCSGLVGNSSFSDWNVSNVNVMFGSFYEAPLFNQNISGWDVSNVTDMGALFYGAASFNQDVSSWDVSRVTRMVNMFSGANAFNQDIGSWDVSNVDDMAYMFRAANSFDQNINDWDVSNVSRMEGMFLANQIFNQDISAWDVSNVTSMAVMFFDAELFNQDISVWDVSSATNMESMFQQAISFNQDLGAWDVSNVSNMNLMFWGTPLSTNNYDAILKGWSELTSLQTNVQFDASISQYCSANVERQSFIDDFGWIINDAGPNEECMFITTWKTDNPGSSADNQITIPTFPDETYNYSVNWGDGTSDINVTGNITHSYATAGTYQVSISGDFPRIYFFDYFFDETTNDSDKIVEVNQWGAIKWASMESAFYGCANLDVIAMDVPDLSQVKSLVYMFRGCSSLQGTIAMNSWNVSNVVDMGATFSDAELFNQDLSNWDVSNVTSLNGTFSGAKAFNQNLNNWDVSNVTNLGGVFGYASSFDQPLNNWDVSNVVDFHAAFTATPFNQPLNNWDTSSANTMGGMFSETDNFNQDISNWNVASVEYFWTMFQNASSFNQDISNWDTSNAIEMSGMFENATSFNQDISNWDVSNVTSMHAMFNRAVSFNQNIENWNVSNVSSMAGMFWGTSKFNQPLNGWDVSNVNNMSYMFNGALEFNQDLSGWDTSNVTEMKAMFYQANKFDQNLGGWNISNVIDLSAMLAETSVSLENYDATLIGWGSLPSLKSNVDFGAGFSQFCQSESARQFIIETYGWSIIDGGKVPFCNEDNDADGVLDHLDLCLDTRENAMVDEYGCEIIPKDALQVYVLTPSCIDSADGAVNLLLNVTGHLMDVSITGDSYSNQFEDVASGQEFEIGNLLAGTYTITVAVPEILFEQTYGVTVNNLSSVSGKRASTETKTGTVVYEVAGSKNYKVEINGEKRTYTFESTGQQTIVLNNLFGQSDITISGENDCQGIVSDSFFIGDAVQVYPTVTSSSVNILTESAVNARIFGMGGRLVKEFNYKQSDKVMDVSTLKSGIYLLQMDVDGRLETVKIIKQ